MRIFIYYLRFQSCGYLIILTYLFSSFPIYNLIPQRFEFSKNAFVKHFLLFIVNLVDLILSVEILLKIDILIISTWYSRKILLKPFVFYSHIKISVITLPFFVNEFQGISKFGWNILEMKIYFKQLISILLN